MEEKHRRILKLNRVQLVKTMQVADLWDPLIEKGVFSSDMIEEIQSAGTRRDQARKLVTDLETRGSQAFLLFLACLQDTGQDELADGLLEQSGGSLLTPAQIKPCPVPKPSYKMDVAEHNIKRNIIRDREKDYPMKSDPCGFCLIINNTEFLERTGLSHRTGSDIDREKLKKRLGSFHFEVLVRDNLTGADIHRELRDLAARDHSQRDCCVVVILSHGCETRHIRFPGGVYGTDGVRISVETIVTYFNGTNCPSLRGKPKLFFIQACGGDQKDRGFEVDSESPPNRTAADSLQSDASPVLAGGGGMNEPDAVASLPTSSDILVSYSTFPGFVSWRDRETGSWYVETLDKILGEQAATEDLQTLLVMVRTFLSNLRQLRPV
ncbi:hypothetical protein FKM82_013159 [Ascaphus truei]